jgi:hypothetical protein
MLLDQSPSWKQATIILSDPNFKKKICKVDPRNLPVGGGMCSMRSLASFPPFLPQASNQSIN